MSKNSYSRDVEFLRSHAEVIEISAADGSAAAIVPEYQGRVMTSTLAGADGASYGWINADFISSGISSPVFNNYGGEDRFWLGPEGGQYALWFTRGDSFDMERWKTPAGFGAGAFDVTDRTADSVTMARQFQVKNFSGAVFDCLLKRAVTALGAPAAAESLGAAIPGALDMVGFESVNTLTNAGSSPWARDSGLVSIWILGMFKPLQRGKVIVPFNSGDEAALGRKVTTDYFGPLPAERCKVHDDHLLFACDGSFRSKIGISPARARDVLGSFDPQGGVLTIVQFNLPQAPTERPWVNSLWEIQDAPLAGDVVNSYNDGPVGGAQLGPFYEIETSSPAAELDSGDSITHVHTTLHFSGDPAALNELSTTVLGVDLTDIA